MERRFELGKVLVTKAVYERMCADPMFELFVKISLGRYVVCDWGELYEEDKALNDMAVKSGEDRILAAYIPNKREEDKIWIITEADRSCTTVLFPSDYYHLRIACEKAHVKYQGTHVLRHTFATDAYHRDPGKVKSLSKVLGHADTALTYNTYIHLYGDGLEEMRKVFS